ncbi:MAG: M10 family metallopeptidase C-terminal domain-containing protein, partial [Pseudomonadota bacterium]
MSAKSKLNQQSVQLTTKEDLPDPKEKNDGTIGQFYADLKGDTDPVDPQPTLNEVFQLAEDPDDGLQPIIQEGKFTTISMAAGPTKNIGSSNLEELMDHLNRDGESWSFTTLKVAFPQSIDDLPEALQEDVEDPEAPGLNPLQPFDLEQIANTFKALDQWADVSGLEFELAGPDEVANIYFIGRDYPATSGTGGQSSGVDEVDGSLIKMNTILGSFEPGTAGFVTLMHEIGHSAGLDHPGDYDTGDDAEYDTHAEYIQDSDQYTIMSYFGTSETGASPSGNQIFTPRTHDIWVTQKLYGADWATRTGDTTYGYNASADVQGTDFEFFPSTFSNPHLTIWDAGGNNDTLDLSLDIESVILNLNPGTFSSTHGEIMNISLAYGPDEATPAGKNYLIENAVGGFADDFLIGNSADNQLDGNVGDDLLFGGEGNDTLLGSWGDDTLWGGFGQDYFDGGDGFDIVDFTHSSADWVFDLYTHSASNSVGSEDLDNIEGIVGSGGDDIIVGDGDANFLDGRNGDDTIDGMSGDDTLKGGNGNDQMFGGIGTNELDGGAGMDTLFYKFSTGEWTVDLLTGQGTNQYGDLDTFENFENITGGDDGDTLRGDHFDNVIFGYDGNDDLHGRDGVDVLYGEEGDDTITGGAGNDVMVGGAGNDTVSYLLASGGVTADLAVVGGQDTGGDGTDFIQQIENAIGSSKADFLYGTDEANRLAGQSGNDQLLGREGNDTLVGSFGDDILEGGLGNDILEGGQGRDAASYYFASQGVLVWLGADGPHNTFGAGIDTYDSIEDIIGSFFNDALSGNDENNRIVAGDGDDLLSGGDGMDQLFGGNGNDILLGGSSNDIIDGGDGNDWARFDNAGDLTVDLADTDEQWTGAGTDVLIDIENLRGWIGDDDLRGDGANNEIIGMSGNDTLYGGAGADTLEGGFGNDKIYVGLAKPYDPADGLKDIQLNPGGNGGSPVDLDTIQIASFTGISDGHILLTDVSLAAKINGSGASGHSSTDKFLPGTGDDGRPDPNGSDVEGQPIGSGPDVIVFGGNWGDDEVFDFHPGGDKLDFTGVNGVEEILDLVVGDTNDGVLI